MKRIVFGFALMILASMPAYSGERVQPQPGAAHVITNGGPGMGQSAFNNVFGDISGKRHSMGGTRISAPNCPTPAPSRRCYWVQGCYKVVYQQVWVPDRWVERWIEPVYEYQRYGGRFIKVCVQQGYYEREQIPGYYETQRRQVWVPGYWCYY